MFERVLSRIGRTSAEDVEDYSRTRYLDPRKGGDLNTAFPLVQQEMARYVEAAALFLAIARKEKLAPAHALEHHKAINILSRDIRRYTAVMFKPDMPHAQADLLASLIEEDDFTASLGDTLFQVARRIERQSFAPIGRELVDATLDQIARAIRTIAPGANASTAAAPGAEERRQFLLSTRERCLKLGAGLPWEQRGAILELLGSAERAFFLVDRIEAERRSVPRALATRVDPVAATLPQLGVAGASG